MTTDRAFQLSLTGHRAPVEYDRPPTYPGMIAEKDVMVPMRDGVKIAVDIYRPDTTEKLPALLAFAIHNKDLQGPEMAEQRPAAAGLVDAVDRPGGSRRHPLSRVARLCPRDRQSARHRQVGRRRLARLRQLRPDRMDRGAALVRRQCRHDRHFRLRRRAVHGGEAAAAASQGDLSVRSARRLRRGRRLPRRISRRRHPSVPLPAAGLLPRRISRRASPSRCRPSARSSGRRRWPIPTSRCIRTSTTC